MRSQNASPLFIIATSNPSHNSINTRGIQGKRGEVLALHHACDLGGARTLDPLIKSQSLYQLSYEVICFGRSLPLVCDCKGNTKYLFDQKIGLIFSLYPDFA